MASIINYEQHAHRLMDPDLTLQVRLHMTMEVHDSLDIINFLKCYFGAFQSILTNLTKPQFYINPEHKLRNIVVKILNRLPHSEVLLPFIPDLLKLSLTVLTTDNDDNALISLRIIFDLLRNFRPNIELEVQPFLEFLNTIYHNFHDTVNHFFSRTDLLTSELEPMVKTVDEGLDPSSITSFGQLNPSTRSIKIFTESLLVIMVLFELYTKLVQTDIPYLLHLMVNAISIPGPEKVPSHLKSQFTELKDVQVKTLSFLTNQLKSYADYIRPHQERLCKSIVNLLVTCPDSYSIRRELLGALKNVLSTNFKTWLFPMIDTLLDERILIGSDRVCIETLRSLAYSLLAEIVHYVRGDLSLSQLSRILYMFSRNMHDSTFTIVFHETCARLILSLVEPIYENGVDQASMEEARVLLGCILDAFAGKLSSVKHILPKLLEEGEDEKKRSNLRQNLEALIQAMLNLQATPEHSKELSEYKTLIKILVMGTKTVIWSITNSHIPRSKVSPSPHGAHQQMQFSPPSNVPSARFCKGMREYEVRRTSSFLKSGVHCLALYKEKDEEKEILQCFSQMLAIMQPHDLMDMFSLCMPELFLWMITNTQLLRIFSSLLEAPKVFRPFMNFLISFLVSSKLDTLKQPDTPVAKLVLNLFRLLFGAISKAPKDCEAVLRPHVPVILEVCIKNSTDVNKPLGYLHLLHLMFRSFIGIKFDVLLSELIPSLQPCLHMLLSLMEGPSGEEMRDLLIELCLTLPVSLNALLPHLPSLMKPLVSALKGSDDLVAIGFRTLEFWIDSLNPDFLVSIISEVLLALWSHLRPHPYPWGTKALQLLGKLGGWNRRFLKEPLMLECEENSEPGFRLILKFEPSTPLLVPLDRCIYLAASTVMQNCGKIDTFYRKQALKFLRVCLVCLLNMRGNITGGGVAPRLLESVLVSSVDPLQRRTEPSDLKDNFVVKTKTQLMAEKSVFKTLLTTIIASSAVPELEDPEDDFVVNLCRHFAMLFHVDSSSNSCDTIGHVGSSKASGKLGARSNGSPSNLKELDPLIFLDALVDVLANENRTNAKAALFAINVFTETFLILERAKHSTVQISRGGTPMMVSSPSLSPVYSPTPSVRIPVFEQLLPRLLHCCYGNRWQAQIGGVMGIRALVSNVSVETLCVFQVKIVRGLIYVLKRLPMHANKEQEETSQVLHQVLCAMNNVDEANNESHWQRFQGVIKFFTVELFNPNASIIVRRNVQSCLALLARQTGSKVSELLEPLYQPLLQNLIMRPLCSKNIDEQVGTVAALNFCLALRPPLLKFTPELVKFLEGALQISEADESVWTNPKDVAKHYKLQTSCIELLCTAIALEDLKTPNHAEFRSKIISMIFKSLTCKSPEIFAVSKEGFQQVVQQQMMPMDILQTYLSPILVNLSETKSVSIPWLQGLARLLELLPSWFNVSLGVKLLDHLKKGLEPEKIAQCQKAWKAGDEPKVAAAMVELFHLLPPAAGKLINDLVTIVIDLEGVLPPGQFYSEINNPYLLPLTKFLNRHSIDAVEYFLARINHPKYFRRLMYIVCSDAGTPLREELAKSPEKILANAFPQFFLHSDGSMAQPCPSSMNEDGLIGTTSDRFTHTVSTNSEICSDKYFHGLELITTMVKLVPNWLHGNRIVFDTLLHVWKSPGRIARLQNEQKLSFLHVKESKWIIKSFLNYLRHDRAEVATLFDMLSIFLVHSRIDYTFLKEFYIFEVAGGYSPELKKIILVHFLNVFQSKLFGQDYLVVAMQILILPMLSHAFKYNQSWEVVDPTIIKTIVDKFLVPSEEASAEYDEPIRIELLQLSTLLLKYLKDDIVSHHKAIIKFGWNHIKRDDNSSKHWAFINVCQFLDAYEVPEKIILKVFVALLRTCQPENRILVKQALDILMPTLAQRLPHVDSRIPIWIQYTKKILIEECHSPPNVIHIFQIIVWHSELFYSFRAQFVPQIVNSLSRLGMPLSENKLLAIELGGVVVSWERLRQMNMKMKMKILPDTEAHDHIPGIFHPSYDSGVSEHPTGVSLFPDEPSMRVKFDAKLQSLGVMSPSGTSIPNIEMSGSSSQPDEEYKTNAVMREMIISFLIRVSLSIETKEKEESSMYKRATELLTQALEVWPNVNVNYSYLDELLINQPSQSKDPVTTITQGLDVMNKVLEKQPRLFIRNNINNIFQAIEYCFINKILDSAKSLCSLLRMVFTAFPLDGAGTTQDVKNLYRRVGDLILKHLPGVTDAQISVDVSSAYSMISFALSIIETLTEVQKSFIDPFIVPLVRILQGLARELGSLASSHISQGQILGIESPFNSRANSGLVISNIKCILKIIHERVMQFPECKRSMGQILQMLLLEKGIDSSVSLCILDAIKAWIEVDYRHTGASSSVLTPKEIVKYLQKLSQVDRKNFLLPALEEWDDKYLNLLYGTCADPKYPLDIRQEVFQKVERQFVLGLRAKDPNTRHRFFSLYHDNLGKNLFSRIQYIIHVQNWEAVSDAFWLTQGLDILLAILVENESITLAPNSAQVPPLLASDFFPDSTGVQAQLSGISECSDAPVTFDSLVTQHAQFLTKMSKLQVSDLVIPLRELAYIDSNMAYHLWVLIFPIIWTTLQDEEQVLISKSMISLLSQDYHKKQKESRPNVVQALLEGLHLSQPQPQIPCELIKFIGSTYNAWHTSLAFLESHAMLFVNDTKCFESLVELYRLLNEEDMLCGLWKRRSITVETSAGLSLAQHGYWEQAQSLFYQVMTKATHYTYNNTVHETEMCFCEEQWIHCTHELSQWDALADFGKSFENYQILLDCTWKIPDWAYMKEIISKVQVQDTPKHRLVQAYFTLNDRNINGISEAKNLVVRGVELALEQWWQLPELSIQSRTPLLQQFQQLVEVQESTKILLDISNGRRQTSGNLGSGVHLGYANLMAIVETWRLRTPNEWDNLSVWCDLLQWRIEMYNIVMDAFKDFASTSQQLQYLGYRGKAWNVNKLAHIARKQGLYNTCVRILDKMYCHSTMDMQEAFVKIREQTKAYLQMEVELTTGLNLINNTNHKFHGKYKAEIFRLKGDFLLKMNDCENAKVAYSNTINLCHDLARGWISWGNYCDMIYKDTHQDLWLEYIVSCFLQGIKYGVSNCRSHLARVLYLLSFDTPNEVAGKEFDKYLDQLPHWVWLSWIPQLLLSLQRSEALHCKLVLIKITVAYPQALYYWLRTYLMECCGVARQSEFGRNISLAQQGMKQTLSWTAAGCQNLADENARATNLVENLASEAQVRQRPQFFSIGSHERGSSQGQEPEICPSVEHTTNTTHDQTPQNFTNTESTQVSFRHNGRAALVSSTMRAFNAANDIMEALRNKHSNLASELEVLLCEIGSRFVPHPEERLLAVVNTLLYRCYKYPIATATKVPESLMKTLSETSRAYFSGDIVNKHVEFVRKYKENFEHDFDPENTATLPTTLSQLTERLKHWKDVLQTNVEDGFPSVLKLEEESKVLRDFQVVDVEIPGQYFVDQEVAPDHRVKLERVGADIPIVRRHGRSFRRLTLLGSDGSQHHFIVQTSLTPTAKSDERVIQLFRVLNKMFEKHKESRKRHLAIYTPIIIPVSSQVRLVEHDLMSNTFLEIYEINCARHNREIDTPITLFKEQLNNSRHISPEAVVQLRRHAYNEITRTIVNDNIFSTYMYKILPSGNHLWAFKKQFAVQLSLTCFMSYILQIGGRSPDKILFAKNTGRIFQADFHPVYDTNGIIGFSEPVPFRLTRNMQAFFSHFGVDGLLVPAMCAAAQSVASRKRSERIWHELAMFFRDELLSWPRRVPLGFPPAPVAAWGINPLDLKQTVTTNVDQVIDRIKRISPEEVSEEEGNTTSVQRGVMKLVEAALSPKNLCMMDPTWHPWF